MIRIRCIGGHAVEIDPAEAAIHIDAPAWVSDPLAVVRRLLHHLKWRYRGGPVDLMSCPQHPGIRVDPQAGQPVGKARR